MLGPSLKVDEIEIVPQLKGYARAKLPLINYMVGDIRDYQGEKPWDSVTCSHTIEHVRNPEQVVAFLATLARRWTVFYAHWEEERLIPGHNNRIDPGFLRRVGAKLSEVMESPGWIKTEEKPRCVVFVVPGRVNNLRGSDSLGSTGTGVAEARRVRQTAGATLLNHHDPHQVQGVSYMSVTQKEKAARFRALHDGPGAFVIPNPWDVASARILDGLGFEALATSSAASACALGRRDGELTRDEALAHARMIVNATDLPVSADLERGFGDAPEIVAETVRRAADAGLVGCTIEDTTGNPDGPLYDFSLAVERIAAAAQTARALSFPFVLTARAHNLMYANPSLDETIKRLHAFEQTGADVLFAPGLPDLTAVRAVCTALSKPVNFMVGIKGKSFSVAELAGAGVKRISLATSLYRAAMTGFLEAASEVKNSGEFRFLDRCASTPELVKLMRI